uniref:Photosystem I reaction center subunit XI n=1 Tax=Vaucheria litorea TaxID=109269 RepID=B7T210_VAULI|nr:photosystem I subunit XI [Vaucheria litorea]ACF70976.1 PSI reaction center subunit XI [Vaucheria litorea]
MANFIKPYNNDPFVGHLSTPITTSLITKTFLGNLPIYRENLSPLFRGLEVGMAHGYLLVGPFEKLGPLRNSEVALLSGFVSALGLIIILVLCLVIYGKASFQESPKASLKITNQDLLTKEGWSQFTSGFSVGAFGGAGFAYLLLLNITF